MNDYSAFVPNVKFELIPIKNLVSNQDYQRNLSWSHVQRTAANFDLYQINPVKVSRRDGLNIVFNGQHTIEAVVEASGSRETPVWCRIYDDLGYKLEAVIFANQQKYVKPLTPYEIFMAHIEADNDDQLMIRSLVESCGLVIAPGRAAGGVCAITTMETIYRRYGYHVLDRVLRLCVATWEGDPLSLSANMFNGVTRLIMSFGETLKDEIFREKVGMHSARSITRTAKERGGGAFWFAEVMLEAYNKRSKTGLHRENLFRNRAAASVHAGQEANDDT
jgi:hypothetical protein